ncbi:MAG: hypothetical protein J7L23_05055 [Candidatus Diapherotrites archaeon]|nr:hypothetical protein [Candidatus Diapherotrites archaeon]
MKAVGIYRESFLAGSPDKDAMILRLTAEELRKGGISVELRQYTNLNPSGRYNLVFSMARSEKARQKLQAFESKGVTVVNSPEAVGLSLNRELAYKELLEAGVSIPKSEVRSLNELELFKKPLVLKRVDRHEQWFIVKGQEDLDAALEFYRSEKVKKVIAQEFIDGSHLKFYAIDGKFFIQPCPRAIVALTRVQAVTAGKAIGLEIYGGDFIVSGKQAYLVDLNDWPSFGGINGYTQGEAAREIASYLSDKMRGVK